MTGSIKDYTPNYKFIIPRFDLATWHDYIESNFRSIDALLYNIFVVNGYKGEWTNSTLYEADSVVFIGENNGEFTGKLFKVLVEHTTPNSGNFETFYENNPNKYEQFADFDAAERAAQLAKDWANKLGSTVDGLEYSAKYYAQLAQQTVNSKANNNEVVHLSGTETIAGDKTFTSNVRVSKTVPCVDLYNTNITKGTVPSSSQWGRNAMLDKDGKLMSMALYQYNTAGETHAAIRAYSPNNETDYAQISIYYPPTGSPHTNAPRPTDTTTSNGTQIATTGWVNSVGNNVVHLSGSETIAGTKTFTAAPYVNLSQPHIYLKSSAVTKGTAPASETEVGYVNFSDKDNAVLGRLRCYYNTNKDSVTRITAYKANSASDSGSGSIGVIYPASGGSYGFAPASDVNGSILTTVNKSKSTNGYYKLGNGLIIQWGITSNAMATDSSVKITLPTAFTSSNYSVSVCQNGTMQNGGGGIDGVDAKTTTSFTLNHGNDGSYKYMWIAIGY